MTIGEVIKHLQTYDSETPCSYDLWLPDDVKMQAAEQGLGEITDDQAADVLELVEHHKDATLGINWTTIDCALDEIRSRAETAAARRNLAACHFHGMRGVR